MLLATLVLSAGCDPIEPADAGTAPRDTGTGDAGVDVGSADAGLLDAGFARREPWAPFPSPEVRAPLFDEAPWLRDDANGWRTSFDPQTGQPGRAVRGAVGLGNGVVFGFVGIGEPDLATLHEAVGPAYDKGDAFFSDVTQVVTVGGARLEATAQHQWRIRGTAIGVTMSRYDGLDVIGIDLAPFVRGSWGDPARPEERALVRMIAAVATAGALSDVNISWVAHESVELDPDGALRQRRSEGARTARLVALGAGGSTHVATRSARLELGDLAPGAEARGVFALTMTRSAAEEVETLAALASADPVSLVTTTRDGWRARTGQGASLEAPIPMLVDLVDSLRVALLVQQGANGAVCPMSEYTRTWLRDTIGPVLGLSALGHHEEVRDALDYLWLAIVHNGDLRNSMRADLEVPTPLPADPGFALLGPLTGRTRAEGPSWVVLAHDELARWTGTRTELEARIELLLRAARQQEVGADGLLPFSGDETYRTAMAIALGHPIAESFEVGFRSLEASVLLTLACERLAGHADALGRPGDATALRTLAARARSAADHTYERASDGALLPYLDPIGALASEPFEDASLAPAWLGYLDAEPSRLSRSVRAVWDAHRTDQGFPMAPPAPGARRLLTPAARAGLYTGMSPAVFLGACTRADLAEGDGALDALSRAASTTGSYEEYQTFSEHGSMAVAYDAQGMLGEYTARYRPWEGGIALRALLDWLIGLEPRSLGADGTIALRVAPHLPAGWPGEALRGARVGDAELDVAVSELVEADQRTRTLTVTRTGGAAPISLVLGFRGPGAEILEVRLDGVALELATLSIDSTDGRLRLDLPPASLEAGSSRELTVRTR